MAARDVAMIDIRCGRCDRHGRRPVKRLLARYGPDASIRARRGNRFSLSA